MDLRAFGSELRRRRVVRLALVYIVVAWVVIQAASTMLPALAVPEWGVSFVVALSILGFPIALVVAWAFDLTPEGVKRTPGRRHPPRPAPPTTRAGSLAPESKSIAVLPFLNMSGDEENEYFSDGMTEEILNALVKVDGLRVASRTSSFTFKGKELDIREIGEQLGVSTVLEGSVRKAGTRVRVTAQLIQVEDGFHLWSESFDRELEDVFAIQDEIARSVADALRVKLVGGQAAPLVVRATDNLEAYTLYLKGRFYFNKMTRPDLHRSLDLYQQALGHDPSYARAHAGIADSWMTLADDWVEPAIAYPKAKAAALEALAIEPALAEANTALGKVLGWHDWNFDAGELALRRAVAANPRYADAHWGLGSLLPANGRLEEALAEMRTALALEPYSALLTRWIARFLLFLRRYDEAITQARAALEIDPQHAHAHVIIGHAQLARGQPAEALETYRAGAGIGSIAFFNAFAARALAELGRVDEARRMLQDLERDAGRQYVRPEALAAGYGGLGDFDRAFTCLQDGLAARSAGLIYLHVDPAYDPLRADPRFTAVVDAVGLRVGVPA